MTEFKHFNDRTRQQQTFDRKKITITKAGKTYNVYDTIQESREDTEIYPTLERYGCIDRMIVNTEEMFGDFTKAMSLRDIYEQQKQAEQLWYSLPLEVRKDFDHDPKKFVKDGQKYFEEKIAKEKAEKGITTDQNTNTDTGVEDE